jgi:hypothetical protein
MFRLSQNSSRFTYPTISMRRPATPRSRSNPSGGSADSMTLAVGHREDDVVVLDAIRERKPLFSPEDVVSEFAELLKSYRVTSIGGDRTPENGRKKDSATTASATRPRRSQSRISIAICCPPSTPRLLTQLVGLERRTARGGRDPIEHAPGAHDDLANAVAGPRRKYAYDSTMSWVS